MTDRYHIARAPGERERHRLLQLHHNNTLSLMDPQLFVRITFASLRGRAPAVCPHDPTHPLPHRGLFEQIRKFFQFTPDFSILGGRLVKHSALKPCLPACLPRRATPCHQASWPPLMGGA